MSTLGHIFRMLGLDMIFFDAPVFRQPSHPMTPLEAANPHTFTWLLEADI